MAGVVPQKVLCCLSWGFTFIWHGIEQLGCFIADGLCANKLIFYIISILWYFFLFYWSFAVKCLPEMISLVAWLLYLHVLSCMECTCGMLWLVVHGKPIPIVLLDSFVGGDNHEQTLLAMKYPSRFYSSTRWLFCDKRTSTSEVCCCAAWNMLLAAVLFVTYLVYL